MKCPLIPINILSFYKDETGASIPLPARMAKCTPDTHRAITSLEKSLAEKGGELILSDLFRSYAMQDKAFCDHIANSRRPYSPPPGESFHEAGRAFDIDINAIKNPLIEFWRMAAKVGVVPIIKQPKAHLSEAWHFECRGSHQLLYNYFASRGGRRFGSAYREAVSSAILSIGVNVDSFNDQLVEATIQSGLIRLGKDIGNLDGEIGPRSKAGLKELGLNYDVAGKKQILRAVEQLLERKFPAEYAVV